MCETGTASSMCPIRSRRTRASVTSTPQRSQITPLCLMRLYFPHEHSQSRVGIGEGGYGPAAPTILSDLFPIEIRGRIMAIFCAAIPVGSALGYVIGGLVGAHLGWRWAFYLVAPPGLLLGLLCFWQRDPRVAEHHLVQKTSRRTLADYMRLFRTRSYLINCIAQTLMTF